MSRPPASEISEPDSAGAPRPDAATGPTTMASFLIAIANTLAARGIDSRFVFELAGKPRAPRINPLERVPIETMRTVLARAVEVTGDPYIGLAIARYITPAELHALGLALQVSANLRDFGERLARGFRAVSSVVEVRLLIEGNTGA